jgi:quercetin dioxygenase-like cupin family protein
MKRIALLTGLTIAVGIAAWLIGTRALHAESELAKGKVLQRTELAGATGKEAVLVFRQLPPGAASGKHFQTGNEVAYILEGSGILEVEGKPPVTLKAGETFQTGPRQIHNVKNASATAPMKALVFYIVSKGKALPDISVPVK